jgi:hypothetical protein
MQCLEVRLPLTLFWNCVHCKIDCHGGHGVPRDLCLDDVGGLGHGRGHCHREFVFSFAHVDQTHARKCARNFGVYDVLCLFDLESHDVCDVIAGDLKETETGFVFVLLPCLMVLQ